MILARVLYLYGADGRDSLGEHAFLAMPSPGDCIHIPIDDDVKRFRVARIDHFPSAKGESNIFGGAPTACVIVNPWRDK